MGRLNAARATASPAQRPVRQSMPPAAYADHASPRFGPASWMSYMPCPAAYFVYSVVMYLK